MYASEREALKLAELANAKLKEADGGGMCPYLYQNLLFFPIINSFYSTVYSQTLMFIMF